MRPELIVLTLFLHQTDTSSTATPNATEVSETSTSSAAAATEQPPPETAREPPPEPQPEQVPVPAEEEIVVTGSRIRTNRLDAPAPITQLTAQDIEKTGLTSVADVLQRLPVSGGALNAKFNTSGNLGFPADGDGIGAGAAQADLRYLGSKRVLVLVDGVRWVNGSSASGVSASTDLNTIPVGMIDHVEVLQDGASAIYGSDAISGVVNIITKKNFDGVAGSIYFGGYGQGDGLTQNYDLTLGTKSDRLSIVLGVSYVRQDEVWSGDRKISSYPVSNQTQCTPQCSSGTPQGRVRTTDPNTGTKLDLTLNNGVGGLPRYDAANPTSGDYHAFDTPDRFNFAPFNYMLTPSRRFGAFTQAQYKLTDAVALNTKILYANRSSKNQAAPEPIFVGPDAGNGNRLDRISIDATNPYNPFGFTLSANDPAHSYVVTRRPIEAGPRLFRQTVNTWYVSGGLSGSFAIVERPFFWDATLSYGRNRADQIKTGGFNSAKLEKALGPIDVCNADPECVPFNIFGGQGADGKGTITREMLDYVTFTQHDISEQEVFDAQANVTAEVGQLPAGPLGVAAGIEYRKLNGYFQPDPIVTAGDSTDVPASPTRGDYGAGEFYAEMRIPILAEMTAANLLDVSGAIRVSDYSTFGTEKTFKIGARYRPFQDLLLRGTWGQGFRAPGIGELYGTEARYDKTLADPCSDFNGTKGAPATAEKKQNCIDLGVPADGSYEQLNSQISIKTGGNGTLQPETSNGYTLSLVYSPSALEGSAAVGSLDFELSYFRVNLDNAIRAPDAQVQLDDCITTKDPAICGGISRTPSGVINGFQNILTNVGGLKTDGIDFTINYATGQTGIGQFYANWMNTFLITWTELLEAQNGFREVKRVGRELGDPEQAFPRVKSTLQLGWVGGQFGANVTGRFISSVTEECRELTDLPDTCSDFNMEDDDLSENVLAAKVYLDAQATWRPGFADDKLNLTLGVNNVLNTTPPACYSCALNGMDASTYDVPGVFGYVRAGYALGD